MVLVKLIAFADNDVTKDANAVNQAMIKEQADVYCFVGDGPYSKDGVKWTEMMGESFNDKKDKLMMSRGNHDTKSSEDWKTQEDIAAWYGNGLSPRGNWLMSKQFGNIFIISLDTEDMDVEFLRDQYNWAIGELQKAKQMKASGQIDWIVILFHKPFFTLKSSHSPYTAVRKIYNESFLDAEVDFCISGHNHNTQLWYPMTVDLNQEANGLGVQLFSYASDGKTFDFTKPHGPAYIVTGHAGHEWNEINDQGEGVNNVIHYRDSGKFGFTSIEFDGKKAHIISKDTDSQVTFEYNVTKYSGILGESDVSVTTVSLATDINSSGSLATDINSSGSLATDSSSNSSDADSELACFYHVQKTVTGNVEGSLATDINSSGSLATDINSSGSLATDISDGFEGERDLDTGVLMLHKITGNKIPMQKGSDHENGQRYNVNHKFENYMMIGYFKTGKGQEVIEMKTDGPNHGGCKKLPKCCWLEPDLDIADCKASLGAEFPHPTNHNDRPAPSAKTLNISLAEKWIGFSVSAYWTQDGSNKWRTVEMWVDPDPFDAKGQPKDGWIKVLHETDKGQITTPELAKRSLFTEGAGLEAEIRCHNATNHDTDMKWCYIYEIIPPT
jgi:predicted phosphodiesterase